MFQKNYHIKDFSDGSFEQTLEQAAVLPEYRNAAQVLLVVLEQNWDVQEIKRKCHLIKKVLPKAEIAGITHYDGRLWGEEMRNQSVLNFFCFEHPSFVIRKFPMAEWKEKEIGRRMNECFQKTEHLKGVMVFLAELLKNVDVLIQEAGKGLKDIPIFGGTGLLSIAEEDTTVNYVFDSEGCYRDMVLSVLFFGEQLHVKASYNYGWTPIGKKMTITKTEGDFRVTEIDHEPALLVYEKYFGLLDPKYIFVANICEFPLIMYRDGLTIARVPVQGYEDGSLGFMAPVREGDVLQFSYGTQLRIFSDIYHDSVEFAEFSPQGMFLVICMNRVIFLKEQERHEVGCYKKIRSEIAYLHGNSEIYYMNGAGGELNSALVAVGFREGEEKEDREIVLEKDVLKGDREENQFLIPLEYRVMNFMHSVTDDLEQMTEKANAASQAKSAFLSGMSHEIRTPINAVLGMNEMILRETKEPQTAEYAENIRTAGNSLLGLVNDILDFSKIEAGKMDIIPVEYELSSVLNDLVNMIQLRAEKKGLELFVHSDPEMPNVLFGDEIRLKQVVTNILTNAVKYTEKGSVTLTVDFERTGNQESIFLEIHVKDTGIGIKEEDQKKLFSAFERIEEERNRNIEGTGLGMNITTSLLKMMGSELKVDSVYGQGSDFYFVLEQKVLRWDAMGDFKEAFRRSAASRKVYKESFTAPDAMILAVDDMPMNLTVLKGLLKQTRIIVDTAESGQECLDKMTEKKYDVIFLDHQMPKMDGIETKRKMAVLEGNKNAGTPVVALTANAVSGARETYIKNGFSDYLTKPIDTVALEKMLMKYLPKEKILSAVSTGEEEGLTREVSFSDGQEREKEHSGEMPVEELSAEELSAIESMDVSLAKMHLPDMELLRMALSDFYQVIDVQADKLDVFYQNMKKAEEEMDGENIREEFCGDDSAGEVEEAAAAYRIQVHGMKSAAATIGLTGISGMARLLEYAARDGKIEKIHALHDIFIGEWRNVKEELHGVWGIGKDTDGTGTEEFNRNEFNGLLEVLRTSMEVFDLDMADQVVEQLKKYDCPRQMSEEMNRLYAAVADVDEEMVDSIIGNLIK